MDTIVDVSIYFVSCGALCFLLGVFVRELFAYYNLNHYRKQGIKCYYWPVAGIDSQFVTRKTDPDALTRIRRFVEDNKEEPIVMFNQHRSVASTGFLLDPRLIKELILNEIEFSARSPAISKMNLGLFFDFSSNAKFHRAAYTQFFLFDNIKTMTSTLSESADLIFKTFTKSIPTIPDEKVKINLEEFLEGFYRILANRVLFDEEECYLSNGKSLTTEIENNLNEIGRIINSPSNLYTYGLLHDLGILPKTREYVRSLNRIEEEIHKIFLKRMETGPKSRLNLLDILISRYKEIEREGGVSMTKKEIAGDFIKFQVAAVTPCKIVAISSIMMLAENPNHEEEFSKIAKEAFGKMERAQRKNLEYEDTEVEGLDFYSKEFLRLGAPIGALVPKQFFKPCRVGKYTFRAGDSLILPNQIIHSVCSKWENPLEFDPSRWTSDRQASIEKTSYIPFGMGSRNCLGRSLGELSLKIVLLHFTKHFCIHADSSYVQKKIIEFNYGYSKDASVLISLR